MQNKTEGLYSWPVIIVLLFLFWPVGLYLLYKRAQSDKKTALTASKILNIFGIILIILGIPLLFIGIGIFYLIAGIVLKIFAKKMRISAENVKKYLAIVINGNMRQIDSIASAIGKSYDDTKKDLQQLIDSGYLKNAYINEATREIVIAQPAAATNVNTSGFGASTRVVSCPCCGANNTIFGAVGECDYCGSPLS